MSPKQMPRRKRVLLFAPDSSDPVSLWADVGEGSVTLLHTYPDLKLKAGWVVAWDDVVCTVKGVDGQTLHTTEDGANG